MLQTLSRKIAAALFVLTGLISILYIVIAVQSTQLYQQEIQQKLNLTLAEHIAADITLLAEGAANQQALGELFHSLMVVNPGIELYLVDARGRILAFNAPPGKVQLERIDLEPVNRFLDDTTVLPIRGTDPRNPGLTKVFSAAPLYEGGELAGYLYIVLGGENYDNAVDMIRDSYILRLLFWIGAGAFILSLCAGLVSFNWLTRRIRRMSEGLERFRNSRFQMPIKIVAGERQTDGDEIDTMATTIEEMSQVIVDQLRQLRQADETRRELIANISHDLRTPLTSMQGYLETLQIKKHELPAEEQDRYVDLAIKQSARLSRLITDLFELSRLDNPDSEARKERFSLTELVQDVTQKFELKAEQKDLHIDCDIPADAPYVNGDIAMIERVLENLIENAIKFSGSGGRIRVAVAPGDGRLEVKVIDNGVGIASEELPNLFQRFYCVDRSRSDRNRSNGLGLAIAHRIMQLHSGTIDVTSQPGKGSCFKFSLPIA